MNQAESIGKGIFGNGMRFVPLTIISLPFHDGYAPQFTALLWFIPKVIP
jgi:hypothetical protein